MIKVKMIFKEHPGVKRILLDQYEKSRRTIVRLGKYGHLDSSNTVTAEDFIIEDNSVTFSSARLASTFIYYINGTYGYMISTNEDDIGRFECSGKYYTSILSYLEHIILSMPVVSPGKSEYDDLEFINKILTYFCEEHKLRMPEKHIDRDPDTLKVSDIISGLDTNIDLIKNSKK